MTAAHVGLVSEPNGRGTLSVILKCIFTWYLCVWTIHRGKYSARSGSLGVVLLPKICFILWLVLCPECACSMPSPNGEKQSGSCWTTMNTEKADPLALCTQPANNKAKSENNWGFTHINACVSGIFVTLPLRKADSRLPNRKQFT